jgi:prophage antirepressor-like protein
VTREVLPAIRKHGYYATEQAREKHPEFKTIDARAMVELDPAEAQRSPHRGPGGSG